MVELQKVARDAGHIRAAAHAVQARGDSSRSRQPMRAAIILEQLT